MMLGWFVNFMPTAWNRPWAGSDPRAWTTGEFYLDMARALERASLDFIMLEDSSVVPESYGKSMKAEFQATTKSPKQDPIALAAAISQVTQHLGIVSTMSTSLYPPDRLAHVLATLDELSDGRVGWNIVTSFEDLAAQNVGLPALWQHDERYVRAEEFVTQAEQLWGGGGSLVSAGGSPIVASGAFGTVSAPQGTLGLVQGDRPLYCQAGGSPTGMDFAAAHADVIVAAPTGVPAMKAYRDGIRERLERAGKDPDSVRVLYMITPVVGETEGDARAKAERLYAPTGDALLRRLVMMSNQTEIDFAEFDLDAPIPADATTNGITSALEAMKKRTAGSSLRAALSEGGQSESLSLIGTPSSIADTMESALEEVGGDGFLLFGGGGGLLSRRYLDEVLDGLVPELQRRGLAQTSYAPGTFRERVVAV
ncbi:NtaA/DmoA family FMN-dependent monooxygenase [Frondihabitans cladoniiphilus]|uniref:NtaA/DmoA family FMN-dependent monooxygenase n=2 Tax=Frondihabitans cladoniiphilus TaxID=715785 RepID=A0ABP8W436_9MICO